MVSGLFIKNDGYGECSLDRILTISRVVIARIRGDPETRANLEMNGGGPIKIGAY